MGVTPSKGRLDLSLAPAVGLTPNSPTLPVDGAPAGFPTYVLHFGPQIPDELSPLYAYPHTYLISPEIAIGQADVIWGYDPAEKGAEFTPLGHRYEQPQEGWGNAWGGWHRLIPTRKVTGWQRTYACNWLTEGFRLGWHETSLTLKEPVTVPDKGLYVVTMKGELWQGTTKIGTSETPSISGPLARGTFATLEDRGGAVVLIGTGNDLVYEYGRGNITVYYRPNKAELAKGDTIYYTVAFAGASGETTTQEMLDFAAKFGISTPGTVGYQASVTRGKLLDNYMVLRLGSENGAAEVRIPRVTLPGFLPVSVEGLNDNWSVILLDKARPKPNFRALPIRDGRTFAQIDTCLSDSDLFIGHPLTANRPEVKLLVSWQEPGKWFVEAHNPTDQAIQTTLKTNPGWTVFAFQETMTLAPGSSQVWTVTER